MYELVKRLVDEKRLTFSGNHKTNMEYALENEKNWFLKNVKDNLRWDEKVLLREYCFECGKYIDYHLEGEKLIPSVSDCFSQEEVEIEIPVPSGVLMLDDWYEDASKVIRHLDDNTHDINCTKVRVDRTHDYAKAGIGHFYCPSSPYVYQKENKFFIGNGPYDEEKDENLPVEPGAIEIDRVYTELRWVTVCDPSVYKKIAIEKYGEEKGKKLAKRAKENADVILQVEPGIYKIKYYTNVKKPYKLYATLEKK